jgi:hypothetical protein
MKYMITNHGLKKKPLKNNVQYCLIKQNIGMWMMFIFASVVAMLIVNMYTNKADRSSGLLTYGMSLYFPSE